MPLSQEERESYIQEVIGVLEHDSDKFNPRDWTLLEDLATLPSLNEVAGKRQCSLTHCNDMVRRLCKKGKMLRESCVALERAVILKAAYQRFKEMALA